jgi:hypothetical protein
VQEAAPARRYLRTRIASFRHCLRLPDLALSRSEYLPARGRPRANFSVKRAWCVTASPRAGTVREMRPLRALSLTRTGLLDVKVSENGRRTRGLLGVAN